MSSFSIYMCAYVFIYPGFVRARYNIAVACLNLNMFKEAVQHLVAALEQQQTDDVTMATASSLMSDDIWSLLLLDASS